MASVIILIVIILAALLCIRAGAIALELTGMAPDKARFQALSAFTNTGFTTREAEEIVRYPIRRRIITVLIVLGYAGMVSVIATLATSLFQQNFLYTGIHLGVILVALYVVYRLASWRGITSRLGAYIRRWLLKRYELRVPTLESMLSVAPGFGVVRVEAREGSSLLGRPLQELDLKSRRVQILSILRGADSIPIPQGHEVLRAGDVLTCYGDVDTITEMFAPQGAAT